MINESIRQQAVARATQWQIDNKDRHNEHVKSYGKRNPEIGKAAYKRWVDKNRGTVTFAQRSMLNQARRRSKASGLDFTISIGDIIRVWPDDNCCPALGFGLDLTGKNRWHSPSLDRIDSSRGYTPDNIIVVSYRANSIKQDSTLDELEALLAFYRPLITKPIDQTCNFGNTYCPQERPY